MKREDVERSEEELDASYVENVDCLLGRFSSLIEHVQEMAFPSIQKGIFAPPDLSNRSWFGRFVFYLSSPLPSIVLSPSGADKSLYSFIVWAMCATLWYSVGDGLLEDLFGATNAASPTVEADPITSVSVYFLLVVFFAVTLASYWRWVEFLRDRRYPVWTKIIVVLIFAGLLLTSPYWLLNPEYRSQVPSCLLQDSSCRTTLLIIYGVLIFPLLTFGYTLLLDGGALFLVLLARIVRYVLSAHDPFPKDDMRELAVQAIREGKDTEPWQLATLSDSDLRTLRMWAEANRESTDKRLVPTAILFGVLGIFANTETVSQGIDKFLSWLLMATSSTNINGTEGGLPSTAQYIAVGLAMGPLLLFMYSLALLFQNLVVQSLIVETCIIVEHARDQQALDTSLEPSPKETRRGCLLFWRRR
jgi:hypothetical protein